MTDTLKWDAAAKLYAGGGSQPWPTVPTVLVHNATVVAFHDGDTGTFDVELGFGDTFRTAVRFLGCNAIELSQPGGKEARDNVAAMLPPGTPVVLQFAKADKFGGRIDAAITYLAPDGTPHDLVADLVAGGWAAPWSGTGKEPVPAWPRVAGA